MEVEMNKLNGFFGVVLSVLILTSIPVKTMSQNLPVPEKVVAEKTMNGQLVKVDTQTKIIGIKGADQREVTFLYNDDTQIVTPDRTIQGLTGKAGAETKVTYREERGANLAIKVEVMEKQP
jgi:hypothetical protein